MVIDENTKVFARLHSKKSGFGMDIYNPYFQQTGYSCVYPLFVGDDPAPLIEIVRNSNVVGAIPAGFEKDAVLAELMDDLAPTAKKLGKVAVIKNDSGRLVGEYQGGYGLLESILTLTKIDGKKLVLFGAGNVIGGFLFEITQRGLRPSEVEIYTRTVSKAEELAKEYSFVSKVGSSEEMLKSKGDIFVSGTGVGQEWKEPEYEFDKNMIGAFDYVIDAGFVPAETSLIRTAKELGKEFAPGYVMFAMQAKRCLEFVHELKVDDSLLLSLTKKALG